MFQIKILSNQEMVDYINSLPDTQFDKNKHYYQMKYLSKMMFDNEHKELRSAKDKYILLINTKDVYKIIGILCLEDITKSYLNDSYKLFKSNKFNIDWLLSYIEIRNDYQNRKLVNKLLQAVPQVISNKNNIYISGFSKLGKQTKLNNKIEKQLPDYHFYLLREDDSYLMKHVNKNIISLHAYNRL